MAVRDAVSGHPIPVFDLLLALPKEADGKTRFEPADSLTVQDENGVGRMVTPPGAVRVLVEAPGHEPARFEVRIPDVKHPNEVHVSLRPL